MLVCSKRFIITYDLMWEYWTPLKNFKLTFRALAFGRSKVKDKALNGIQLLAPHHHLPETISKHTNIYTRFIIFRYQNPIEDMVDDE